MSKGGRFLKAMVRRFLEGISPESETYFENGEGERVRFNLATWKKERTRLTREEVYELNWYDSIR